MLNALLACPSASLEAQASEPAALDTATLSLEEAVTRALRAGDEARLAGAQHDVADAQAAVARAAGLPQLRLSGGFTHVYRNARGEAVGQIFNQPNTYTLNANLSQPLFQGGRIFSAARAANKLRDAAELTVAETRSQVAFDVLQAYLAALLSARLSEIQEADYQLAGARLEQVESLERAGRSARYDVLRARVERANREPLVLQARADRELALLELKRLANIPLEQPIRLITALEHSLVAALALELERDSTRGAERPLLRALELQAKARDDAVSVARADLFPSLSVFVQSGYQAFPRDNVFPFSRGQVFATECPPGTPPTRSCTAQNGGWFPDRLLGVQLSWPLFQGLRVRANVDLAQAEAKVAKLRLTQQREVVALEVAGARADLRRARATHEAQRQTVLEAAEALRLARLRLERGLSTQLEVSDAQLALLTAQTNQVRAVHDLLLAAAQLAHALGKPLPLVPNL